MRSPYTVSNSFKVGFHRFALYKNLRLLHRDVDKMSWPLSFPPSTVNAFYMYARNQVGQKKL